MNEEDADRKLYPVLAMLCVCVCVTKPPLSIVSFVKSN